MIWYSLKSQKLTIKVITSGTRKNRTKVNASGVACSQAGARRCLTVASSGWMGSSIDAIANYLLDKQRRPACMKYTTCSPALRQITLSRDELVPLLDHVDVLIHHRVPARDRPHALVVRTAVAHRADFF